MLCACCFLQVFSSCGKWDHSLLWRVGFSSIADFPGGSDVNESACNAGHTGSIPESGRSPGEGNGYRFQYSCLENPWVEKPGNGWRSLAGYSPGVAKSRTWLSDFTSLLHCRPQAPWLADSVAKVHRPSCPVAGGIFLNHGLNLYSMHWQADSHPLCCQGSPMRYLCDSSLLGSFKGASRPSRVTVAVALNPELLYAHFWPSQCHSPWKETHLRPCSTHREILLSPPCQDGAKTLSKCHSFLDGVDFHTFIFALKSNCLMIFGEVTQNSASSGNLSQSYDCAILTR